MNIRLADRRDVPALARVLKTWRATFSGKLPVTFLDDLTAERQEVRHNRIVARPHTIYHVAEDNGSIAGLTAAGPNRTTELPFDGELYAIQLRDGVAHHGLGRQLFRSAAAALADQNLRSLVVWVLASNSFRPFYEALGGQLVHARSVILGEVAVQQVAYAWDDVRAIAA